MLQTLYRPILTIAIVATLAGAVAAQYLMAVAGLDPPTFTSPDTDPAGFNVVENTTAITTVVATGDGTIAYSVSGTDSALVTIGESSGVLAFIDPPNYEGPLDVGGDNVYTFNVVASNGTPASFECNVTVTDEEEGSPTPPTITNADPLNVSMGENSTAVADIDATGDAPITFSISGTDASLFTINSSTGVLSFTDAPDFETPGDDGGNNVYNLTVTATGVSPPDSIDVVVTVTDVEEGSYAYYNTLKGRTDYIDSMDLRSQTDIDGHVIRGDINDPLWPYEHTGEHEECRYNASEDACEVITTGSIESQVGFDLQSQNITTGCMVFVRDLKHNSSLYQYADKLVAYKFAMIGEEGSGDGTNDRRRFESRVYYIAAGTSSAQYLIDVRPYYVGAEENGIGAGTGRITPYTTVYCPTDVWVRHVEKVDFTTAVVEYSYYMVLADDTILTVYEDIECPDVLTYGGLDRWTPLWINTSQSGEVVTLTSSGTTVTVYWPGHGLEVGQPVRTHPAESLGVPYARYGAAETEYNGEWEVASVIDADHFTYICDSTPSASTATPAIDEIRMHAQRSTCFYRNCVYLWNATTIDLTPILVGDDL